MRLKTITIKSVNKTLNKFKKNDVDISLVSDGRRVKDRI